MQEKPKSIDQFNAGQVVNAGREDMPPGAVRRNAGSDRLRLLSLRSRFGGTLLYAASAFTGIVNSLYRFDGINFQADTAGHLYKNGVSIKSGFNGNRLTFAKQPPEVGDSDYLFVGNGGLPVKIDPSGTVTNWGIVAPTTQPTLALAVGETLSILTLDGDHTNWSSVSGFLTGTPTDNSSFYQPPASTSLDVAYTIPAYTVSSVVMKRTLSIDLSKYADATVSPDQDIITMWVGSDYPQLIASIELQFNLTANGSDYYNYALAVQPTSFISTALPSQQQGVNTALGGTQADNIESTFVQTGQVPGVGYVQDPAVLRSLLTTIHRANMPASANSWFHLQVSKSEFSRIGTGAYDWSNVVSVYIKINVTNTANVSVTGNAFFNALEMQGGAGMEGNYSYAVVFANTLSLSISDPQPMVNGLFPTISGVTRQPVTLTNLPTSLDPQVNARLIYRTLGNGATLFFAGIVPDNNTKTFTDSAADFSGFNGGNEPKVLGQTVTWPIQLQTDNAPPPVAPTFIAGPYTGSMFWLDGTNRGRLTYSPTGRPESTENFIDVTNTDDILQTLVIWNNNLYLLSQKYLWIIQQVSTSPLLFIANRILGAPGTLNPFSVIPGKAYLFYQSGEGYMAFDGFIARPFGMDSLSKVFRGESAEDLVPMSVQSAAYVKGEIIMTDAVSQTLAVDENTQAWRNLDDVYNVLYYEEDLEKYIGVDTGNVVTLEVPGTFTDFSSDNIAIDWMTPGVVVAEDLDAVVRRIVIDINTAGQAITPTVILNDADLMSGWIAGNFVAGEQIRDSNGNIQQATTTGATDGVAPVWGTTPNAITLDNGVAWQLVGPGVVTLPPFLTFARQQVEINLGLKCRTVVLQLTGSLSIGQVELFHVLFVPSAGS